MLFTACLFLLLVSISQGAPLSSFHTKARNKLLLVSFDGFRWDYDRDVDTPNLDAMAEDGVKAIYVTPPFLTLTSPVHFTLLTVAGLHYPGKLAWVGSCLLSSASYHGIIPSSTISQFEWFFIVGRYIESHGVIHNMWFNTSNQEKKPYYMTQFVNEWWDNGSLPIWITAQRQSWFNEQDLDFVSLYFGEPDSTGHKYGPDSPERREMVKQVDRTVGYIRRAAEKYSLTENLNIIMTANHGMSTVLKKGMVDEIILSKIPGFSFRDIAFHLLDYGPAGMLLPKEGMLDKVYNTLKGAHPHLHVYRKEEIPRRFQYSNHPRILPIFLYADPGYVISSLFPVQFNNGAHGFDNLEMDMKPFFRAVGPDFRKNLVVGPFETVNIYPLMCHLLGITPEANNGSLDATRHLLASEESLSRNGEIGPLLI
ncbi:ectonucleotide pyrophosphatase/phosphodiesterase family member 7-like [Scleropages formosus]|uniref:Ectonucleotide pyrophosphatase/phosphodiesterase family member 7-like n=1 Tax=Scleropages formosus TaxID=113540 RepID=A0A0P7XT24_SCLFO|nr:ectonucleotide pyrophosphatase/phosphodiesterase family member 7-like [Scleropages formosus]